MLLAKTEAFEVREETAAGEGARSEPKPAAERSAAGAEVPAKPIRRRFDAGYKRRVVAEAERCREAGELGALLRREGLYSSLLATWRRQYRDGGTKALRDDKRGRKKTPENPLAGRVRQLEKENRRLTKKLMQADVLIDLQKKVAAILAMGDDDTDPAFAAEAAASAE